MRLGQLVPKSRFSIASELKFKIREIVTFTESDSLWYAKNPRY